MQGLLEAVNRQAAAVGMRINASKTKQCQHSSFRIDGEPVKDVHKFVMYLGSIFIANGQVTEEVTEEKQY